MLLFGNLASLSPETFRNAGTHVRSEVTALLIRQYTSLSLLGRRDLTGSSPINRLLMSEISRQSEICLSRYRKFAASNGIRQPEIDTRLLRLGASGIAGHLVRGEYAQARMLEERILLDEEADELEALAHVAGAPQRGRLAA